MQPHPIHKSQIVINFKTELLDDNPLRTVQHHMNFWHLKMVFVKCIPLVRYANISIQL